MGFNPTQYLYITGMVWTNLFSQHGTSLIQAWVGRRGGVGLRKTCKTGRGKARRGMYLGQYVRVLQIIADYCRLKLYISVFDMYIYIFIHSPTHLITSLFTTQTVIISFTNITVQAQSAPPARQAPSASATSCTSTIRIHITSTTTSGTYGTALLPSPLTSSHS